MDSITQRAIAAMITGGFATFAAFDGDRFMALLMSAITILFLVSIIMEHPPEDP